MGYRVRLWTAPIYDIEELFEDDDLKVVFLRHLRALYHWPGDCLNGSFAVLDLHYYAVPGLEQEHVWDVRLDVVDIADSKENLRVVVWNAGPEKEDSTVWILWVVQKQPEQFTASEITKIMKRKRSVIETYYGHA